MRARPLAFYFWPAFLLLAPLLWLQGKYARWRTPRLPEASGEPAGMAAGAQPEKQLIVVGESPVVGVGIDAYENALAAQIAAALSRASAHTWHWTACGENGATIARLLEILPGPEVLAAADYIVVVAGVNDTTSLTSSRRWQHNLRQLCAKIRQASNATVVFTPVPPMQCFSALPQPLRWLLGLRAAILNNALRAALAHEPRVYCSAVLPPLEARHLAADGYHPSALACSEWGERIAGEAVQHLQETGET